MNKPALIGIDAGGTKTLGICVSLDKGILKKTLTGGSNHQVVGMNNTERILRELFTELKNGAEKEGHSVAAYCFGISGLDRKKDEVAFGAMAKGIAGEIPGRVCNDTFLILRAGTSDGVGVAVVSGTGANCVGIGRDGSQHRVGGLLSELGDYGGAYDLAIDALRASRRGKDGRGEWTILHDMIVSRFGLSEIEDIADLYTPGGLGVQVEEVVRMVFEAADKGDAVAIGILTKAGKELGLCARLVAGKLFGADDEFPLVMGGSVLQKGSSPHFRETIVADARAAFPMIKPVLLDCAPVAGALMYAFDTLEKEMGVTEMARKNDFHFWLKGELCLTEKI